MNAEDDLRGSRASAISAHAARRCRRDRMLLLGDSASHAWSAPHASAPTFLGALVGTGRSFDVHSVVSAFASRERG
ncbi:hypothetical protein BE20_31175 [Sorangium cellulosum]|nr:hypothetical protein BE20_31175 [Sorangium cellulosum]